MPGLKDLPRGLFGDGFGITPADLAANFTITGAQQGLTVRNETGTTLVPGALVALSGWSTGFPLAVRATAGVQQGYAQYVVPTAILNNTSGTVVKKLTLTGQNTNAAVAAGDYAFLDVTPGATVFSASPASAASNQKVGIVSVKSATVGVIEYDLTAFGEAIGTQLVEISFPTVATTATTVSLPLKMGAPGTIVGLSLAFNSALPVNGTNFVTFSVDNRTQTKLLTSAVVGNSTNTGGQAITQYGTYSLTLTATAADRVVAGADILSFTAVVTGTLGATLSGSCYVLTYPT